MAVDCTKIKEPGNHVLIQLMSNTVAQHHLHKIKLINACLPALGGSGNNPRGKTEFIDRFKNVETRKHPCLTPLSFETSFVR